VAKKNYFSAVGFCSFHIMQVSFVEPTET